MLDLAPSEYKGIDYIDHVKWIFNQYLTILKEYEPSEQEIEANWDSVILKTEEYCDALVTCIEFYYKGLYSKSFITLKKCLDSLPKWKAAHKFTSYKMRVVDEGTMPTFEGMFHIPYDKRGIVKTQRYSAPGLPCLYLGFTPLTCWEEMRRPQLDRTYISRYQPNDFYMYLPFGLPIRSGWNEGDLAVKKFMADLLYFPFVMSSMVKVANSNAHFKPEYIIPQLIMQWLLENKTNMDNPRKKPIGVQYTSVHFDKSMGEDKLFWYMNLAIPCYYDEEKKYSRYLSEWFKFSDPVRCDILNDTMDTVDDKMRLISLLPVLNNDKLFPLKGFETE